MNKLSKDKRDKIVLVAMGGFALVAAVYFLVISGQRVALQQYDQAMLELDDRLNKAERRIRLAARVNTELAEMQDKVGRFEAQMIPREQLNGKKWMLDTINDFMKGRFRLELRAMSNDPLTGPQFLSLPNFDYGAAAYNVEMSGYFHEFGRFLADFENHFPFMSVQNLQVSPVASSVLADRAEGVIPADEREKLIFSMRVVVLYKPAQL